MDITKQYRKRKGVHGDANPARQWKVVAGFIALVAYVIVVNWVKNPY